MGVEKYNTMDAAPHFICAPALAPPLVKAWL